MGTIRPIYCVQCEKLRLTKEFPRRRRMNGRFVCIRCEPAHPGRRTDRHVETGRKYKCQSCSGEFTSDWFDTYSTHGIQKVRSVCRACNRVEAADSEPIDTQLISAILYDFDLARTMFGMSYRETVRWLVKGYRDVTEEQVISWGATENRRQIWQPDEGEEED